MIDVGYGLDFGADCGFARSSDVRPCARSSTKALVKMTLGLIIYITACGHWKKFNDQYNDESIDFFCRFLPAKSLALLDTLLRRGSNEGQKIKRNQSSEMSLSLLNTPLIKRSDEDQEMKILRPLLFRPRATSYAFRLPLTKSRCCLTMAFPPPIRQAAE